MYYRPTHCPENYCICCFCCCERFFRQRCSMSVDGGPSKKMVLEIELDVRRLLLNDFENLWCSVVLI